MVLGSDLKLWGLMFRDPKKTLDTRRPDIGTSYVSTNIGMQTLASGRAGEKSMGTKTSESWEGHPGADRLMHFPSSTSKVCSTRLVITSVY